MGSWFPPKPPLTPHPLGPRTVIVNVRKANSTTGLGGAAVFVSHELYTRTIACNQDGIGWFLDVPEGVQYFNTETSADGYKPVNQRIEIPVGEYYAPPFYLESEHFDPFSIPEADLLNVKGAMWTARYPCSQGPRPGQPTNINVMGDLYRFPLAEQDEMIAAYKGRGYTHVSTGPFSDQVNYGYHDMYSPCPSLLQNPDFYADYLEKLYDNGLIPIYFVTPDNYSIDQLRQFEPIYRSERWQKLIRMTVPYGWEPNSGDRYGISTYAWRDRFAYVNDVFPNAYHWLHMATDFDCPIGRDTMDKIEAWNNVAPYLSGWLDQIQGYLNQADQGTTNDERNGLVLSDYFKRELEAHVKRCQKGFKEGFAGTPTQGAHGHIRYVLGEYAAYLDFHRDWPESVAREIGHLAVQFGADGFFDGGY